MWHTHLQRCVCQETKEAPNASGSGSQEPDVVLRIGDNPDVKQAQLLLQQQLLRREKLHKYCIVGESTVQQYSAV